jgi:hypothetical protein
MKYFYVLLFSFIVLVNCNCSYTAIGHKKIMYKNSNGWFPLDFEPDKVILLIPKSDKKKDQKKMETLLKKYTFRYIYNNDNTESYLNAIYPDATTYRFVFKSYSFNSKSYDSDTHRSYTSYYTDYYIFDRLKNIEYPITGYYTHTPVYYHVFHEIMKYIIFKYCPPKK